MAKKKRKKTPAKQASGAGNGGIVPPVDTRFKPGESGNPKGRPTAGATIREWVNQMAQQDLTEAEVRRIARDPRNPWPRRAAAERILRTMEAGDLADFAGLLSGENNLEDLRGMGVNTEVVKKFKQKTRRVVIGAGTNGADGVEEIIDREIELHDRAGEDFDRVVEHTDGKATQPIKGDIKTTNVGQLSDEELIAACREAGVPLPPGLSLTDDQPKP